jgi:hypothetical protein
MIHSRSFVALVKASVVVVGALYASGCGLHTNRIGAPLHIPPADPTGPCEQRSWLHLVPANSQAAATDGAGRYSTTTITHANGLALYRGLLLNNEGLLPVNLVDALPASANAPFMMRHFLPIEGIRERSTIGGGILFGSLVTVLVGSAVMLATFNDYSGGVGSKVGLGTLVVGGVGSLVGWLIYPSAASRNEVTLRDRLFFPEEDDMASVEQAVAEHNVSVRIRCGGSVATPPHVTGATPAVVGTPSPVAPWATPAQTPPPLPR